MTDTDPYTLAVNALMGEVRTLTTYFPKEFQVSFDPSNKSRGAEYWFFVSPTAPSSASRLASQMRVIQWRSDCRLDVRYKTESESAAKLMEIRGVIRALLERPRALKNINVNRVTVAFGERFEQDTPANQAPNFLIQRMTVTIDQIVRN